MKLENNQSYVTNLQFSGGQPVGSGSLNATTIASGSVALANAITATGSFNITCALGNTFFFALTASLSASDATSQNAGKVQYVAVSGSNTQKAQIIAGAITANRNYFVSASAGATTLALTASFGGSNGNNITVSGSQLGGGSGKSNWPYSFAFSPSQGLYIGVAGDLNVTTVDGSFVSFTSASGFIPGLFTSVSSSSTALAIIALK
jgi:hypothetical protein